MTSKSRQHIGQSEGRRTAEMAQRWNWVNNYDHEYSALLNVTLVYKVNKAQENGVSVSVAMPLVLSVVGGADLHLQDLCRSTQRFKPTVLWFCLPFICVQEIKSHEETSHPKKCPQTKRDKS